ncbi:unnamed protein product [Didymodactylos carnosus]|uniref:Uncharacterized protein n=1 Tax=Didymodactylos carnosus TaxID=1234261 RepID=A0A814DC34_9BILA|nr:unnamed protein product [Didymodactylos carnosus]CAF3728740.1 unnamed protein product [Didymodactylos carnosus]
MASSTTDSLWFVAGSTAEGQAYAVHCGQKSVQDIDIMMVEGTISSPTALIPTNISGFKQIRFDQVKILGGQSCLTSTLNSNGVLCLNGLKMKEHVLSRCRNETTPVAEVPGTDRTEYQTDSAAASVAATQKYDPLASENHFTHVFSDLLHPQQPSLPPNLLKERFRKISDGVMDAMRRYVLPLVTNEQTQKTVTEWCMNEQRFRDLLNMIGPVYGYHLPQKLKQQLQLILDFYDKHKHLSNSFHCKQITDYFKSCMPKEIDWVPAIQIKGFWPDDVKWFLKRFKKNRPHLYDEIIPTTSMHLIAKWPRKTSNTDEELGFRYSFSALERAIAQKRTENEQILNGIARSIYYRYLKTTRNLIPSYFVKTTVLWMCEIMSDLIKKIVGDSSESVARQIGFEWIKFATKQLQQGICPHYFIENVNLLEPYKQELLNEASNTLYEKVNLDQMIQIEFMEIRKQMIEGMYKNDEQFIRQLKVVDLIQAVNDYHEMKHLWSLPVDYNNNDNAVASCLSILNLMGSVDNNQPNWISFRELILKNDEEDEQQQEPPIWGEDVTLWGPSEFTENLRAVALLLKLINEILINESFTDYRCVEYNPHDIQSLQSISREAMNPANMMPYLISVYGSLFTGSSFGMNQNRMKQVLSSFLRRTLIQDQGVGPRLNLQTENGEYSIIIIRTFMKL